MAQVYKNPNDLADNIVSEKKYPKPIYGQDYTLSKSAKGEPEISIISKRHPNSSFEEPAIALENLSRIFGFDYEDAIYGDKGYNKLSGKEVHPYSSSNADWDAFESWIKENRGIDIPAIRKSLIDEGIKQNPEWESQFIW